MSSTAPRTPVARVAAEAGAVDAGTFGQAIVYAETVFVVLLMALLCVPLLELLVIIQVAEGLGAVETILLLVAVSALGAVMVRRCGLGVLAQVRERLNRGELPGRELVDGMLIVVAGALMLTPGFVTDAVGLLLLLAPSRIALRSLLIRYFTKRAQAPDWSSVRASGVSFGYRSRRDSSSQGRWDGYDTTSRGRGFAVDDRGVLDVEEAREAE